MAQKYKYPDTALIRWRERCDRVVELIDIIPEDDSDRHPDGAEYNVESICQDLLSTRAVLRALASKVKDFEDMEATPENLTMWIHNLQAIAAIARTRLTADG